MDLDEIRRALIAEAFIEKFMRLRSRPNPLQGKVRQSSVTRGQNKPQGGHYKTTHVYFECGLIGSHCVLR